MNVAVDTVNNPLTEHLSWRRRIRAGLPDAARMLIAAMAAYAFAHWLLQLREAHWAVLSALITGRAQAGGTARAGVERLAATIAGAALAAAVAAIRAWHVDGAILLFSVLAPLCLLATLKPAYRTAPIAALIVLSSGAISGVGPLGTAILRTSEIAIGSLASVLVSLVVFPARGKARANDLAAAILHRLAEWLRSIPHEHAQSHTEKLREDLRGELRELGVLAYTSGWRRTPDGKLNRLLRVLTALHGDVAFLARSVARKPLHIDAGAFAAPLLAIAAQMDAIGMAAVTGAIVPSPQELREACKGFADAAADEQARTESVFLLRSITIGLTHVAAVIAAGSVTQAQTDVTAP